MKNTLQIIPAIILFVFFSSCQKEFLDPNSGNSIYDADALQFIDSAGLNDNRQKSAINTFVKELKDSSLWPAFAAIYPMVGASAASTKWNLKDPRDLDQAYRLTFEGKPVYTNTGVLFSTISDYADTHLNDSIMVYNDNSISYYSETQNTISGYDMGCSDIGFPANEMAIYHTSDASNWFGYFDWGPKPANTKGLFMFSATAYNVTRYENGIVVNSSGKSPGIGFTGYPVLIGKVSEAPTCGQRVCGLATIGRGLTDAQALTFYNIVQNFETALGR